MPDARGKPLPQRRKSIIPIRLCQHLPDNPRDEQPLYTQLTDWDVVKRLGHFKHKGKNVMLLKAKLQCSHRPDEDLSGLWILYYPSHIVQNDKGGRDLLALRAKIVIGPPKVKE